MSYQHILIAVDLSDESTILIKKGVELAKALNANVSLIHIDVNYTDLYTGLIDINLRDVQEKMALDTQAQLKALADSANYPIEHSLIGTGDLSEEIHSTIDKLNIDLVMVGHHQDFWSKLLSSAKQLINHTPVDTLMIPLK
jgi:universal stress protein A